MEGWEQGVSLMPTLQIIWLVSPNPSAMIQNVVIVIIITVVLNWSLCPRRLQCHTWHTAQQRRGSESLLSEELLSHPALSLHMRKHCNAAEF